MLSNKTKKSKEVSNMSIETKKPISSEPRPVVQGPDELPQPEQTPIAPTEPGGATASLILQTSHQVYADQADQTSQAVSTSIHAQQL